MKIRNHATEAKVAGKIVEAPTTPKRAIRLKCLDCSANQIVEVRECTHTRCPLWPFRMGKNPYHGRAKGDVKIGDPNLDPEDDATPPEPPAPEKSEPESEGDDW